jgi:hypothetical protein
LNAAESGPPLEDSTGQGAAAKKNSVFSVISSEAGERKLSLTETTEPQRNSFSFSFEGERKGK